MREKNDDVWDTVYCLSNVEEGVMTKGSKDERIFADIRAHRACIDEIDEKITALLNERASHSLAIRMEKPEVEMESYDPAREAEITAHVTRIGEAEGPLGGTNIAEIYATILKVMKDLRI